MKYNIIVLFCFLVLSFVYVHPAEVFLFSGETGYFLSDGTDHTPQSYQASILRGEFQLNPLSIFYGSIPTRVLNAPYGMGIWYSWSERVLVLLLSYIVPLEQIVTYDVILMFFFTAVSMYFLGRELAWSRILSFFAAYCWAFSCYTRARAPVHSTFVGLWHIPLLLIGLFIIRRSNSKKDLAIAATLLFISATTAHYYIIITAVVFPLILWYVLAREPRRSIFSFLSKLFLCAIPAFLLFGVMIFKSLPDDYVARGVPLHPVTGLTQESIHPYVLLFGARPIDYLSGDYFIGDFEINPLRALVSKSAFTNIFKNRFSGITHERSHGIRWIILVTVMFAVVFTLRSREPESRKFFYSELLPWFSAAVLAFMLAASPMQINHHTFGVSYWVNKTISQFRFPNRAGIFVEFSFVFIMASFLHYRKASTKSIILLLAIAYLELPPFVNPMPLAEVLPKYESLASLKDEDCGIGIYFPYANQNQEVLKYYDFFQRMRGSRCAILNSNNNVLARDEYLLNKFPLEQNVINNVNQPSSELAQEFVELVKCLPLDWIVFDLAVKPERRRSICSQLGFEMLEPEVCKSPIRVDPKLYNEQCFNLP